MVTGRQGVSVDEGLGAGRDVSSLLLGNAGRVVEPGIDGLPVLVLDAFGEPIDPITGFLRELTACDQGSSCRSYAYDLLRWWRYLAAIDVAWDHARREDVRDLVLWMRQAENPQRARSRPGAPVAGSVNAVTGKSYLAAGYAPRTINHQLAVLSRFYEFHRSMGRGPLLSPVPVASRGGARVGAHGNPLMPFPAHRRGAFRQKVPVAAPRGLEDAVFDELFALMPSHRDRALLACYVSSGARAEELLGMRCGDIDFAAQTITVVGKGTRAHQEVPASADAFVWIRLYLAEGLVGPVDAPLVRGADDIVPSCSRYDTHERVYGPPLPYLFQRAIGTGYQVFSPETIRNRIQQTAQIADLRDIDGTPLTFTPHDFRRLFATEAVNAGLPIHIAAAVLGHRNLDTTRGYTAVYPEETIRSYQAFIASRRSERPGEEYREPTPAEWEEFERHFTLRKVAYGNCARPYGTPCASEHACVRCPMLHTEPTRLPLLRELEVNLEARILEARNQSWLGEVAGLEQTLIALRAKKHDAERLVAEIEVNV